jgi:Domain of unknown function (DUF5979)/Thioester domain
MKLSNTGSGASVTGFLSDVALDVTRGYPVVDNSTEGFTPKDESFAGVIIGEPTDGSPDIDLYCIDIRTDTFIGYGYELGTWDSANVPNVGYVAQLLNSYYPNTDEPSNLTDLNQKAAAVQAAIWFFSDSYVLSQSSPLYLTVKGIVNAVLKAGPLVEPPPPSLTISPTSLSGPAGSVLGPYTVTSSAPEGAAVSATGAGMFTDPTASTPLANGSTVSSGQKIWLKSDGPSSAVLQATAKATVPSGNVYLYDGNSGANDAQRLILSQSATLTSTVQATAEFLAPGSLVVEKTIAGLAAGSQGRIVIHVVCDQGDAAVTPDFIIDARTPAGTQSHTYKDIPAGSKCIVTETENGTTDQVMVKISGEDITGIGQEVTIPSGGSETVDTTDTYTFVPGSLIVAKFITGNGAGLQGQVTIHTVCVENGVPTALTPDLVIPADRPVNTLRSEVYNDIPANSECSTSETEDGSNPAVSVTTVVFPPAAGGSLPATVTIPPATRIGLTVVDNYTQKPGSFVVTKTITGPAAALRGTITIHVSCTGVPAADTPDFVIPNPSPVEAPSMTYPGIPAGSKCTATEDPDSDGSTTSVANSITGDNGTEITIPPGGTGTAAITDTFTNIGDLVVNKVITGEAAGHQGPITITVSCPGVSPSLTPPFPIDAGSASTSKIYPGLPTGSACTVAELPDGSGGIVDVTTNITQPEAIPAGGSAEATVTNTYTEAPGSLVVTKDITGPAAGQQGPITIRVFCGSAFLTPDFDIPAGATGTQSQTYPDIPANSECLIIETVDGTTSTVQAATSGGVSPVTIPAGDQATAAITDTYTLIPGSLIVAKVVSGPFAGQQGPITIHVACTGVPAADTPDFVIPAGTPRSLKTQSYDDIPAGSTCTVTETADGANSVVTAIVLPSNTQTVSVPAATVVAAIFDDVLIDSPGTLRVTKTIAGAAEGKQGEIGILVDRGQPIDQFAYIIPANTPAGAVSRSFPDIPAESVCTVTETTDGSTSTVSVAVTGSGQKVTVNADQTANIGLTDTYTGTTAATSAATLTAATLPATGAPLVRQLAQLGVASIFAGVVFVVLGGRRRDRRRRAKHFQQ